MYNMFVMIGFGALIGCSDKGVDTAGQSNFTDARATDLWNEIQGVEEWRQYSGWEGIVASSSVHGDYVQILMNDAVMDALGLGESIPDGGILLKETYYDAEGTSLKDFTVMKKIEGYNPDGSDWYWAQYLEDGTIQEQGSPALCTGCHAAGEDYIRFLSE